MTPNPPPLLLLAPMPLSIVQPNLPPPTVLLLLPPILGVATISVTAGQQMTPIRRMSQQFWTLMALLGTAMKLSQKLAAVLRSIFHLGGVCQKWLGAQRSDQPLPDFEN